MNFVSHDPVPPSLDYHPDRQVDAKGTQGPVRVLKLQDALKQDVLKKAADHTVFGLLTTDPLASAQVKDFCARSGHDYLGREIFTEHSVYYVKKRTPDCQKCSKIRVVMLGGLVLGGLAYSAPEVLYRHPSALVTVVFAGALASLPAVLLDNLRLLKGVLRPRHKAI